MLLHIALSLNVDIFTFSFWERLPGLGKLFHFQMSLVLLKIAGFLSYVGFSTSGIQHEAERACYQPGEKETWAVSNCISFIV